MSKLEFFEFNAVWLFCYNSIKRRTLDATWRQKCYTSSITKVVGVIVVQKVFIIQKLAGQY